MKKGVKMDQRTELKIRLAQLKQNMIDEDRSDDRSQIYIDDLQSTIDNIESQLKFINKAACYPIINGV